MIFCNYPCALCPSYCGRILPEQGPTERPVSHRMPFPKWQDKYVRESSFLASVSVNGKMKFTLELPKGLSKDEMEAQVLADQKVKDLIGDKDVRKVIAVLTRSSTLSLESNGSQGDSRSLTPFN